MSSQLSAADWEALNTGYAKGDVSREEASRYPLVQRGSIRLVNDLYRTESEQREFIEKGLRVKLPGQTPHSGLVEIILRLVRLFNRG
jgi:hypothetical protein